MGLSQHGYLVLCYCLAVGMLVAVAAFALVASYLLRRRTQTAEDFLTARRQFGVARIAWSMFATAIGAWVISAPASYTPYTGFVGLFTYSFGMGLSVLVTAAVGNAITRKLPHVLSLTDYVGWRYGSAARALVLLLVLFNMAIFMLAEMTTAGALFQFYVGSVAAPIIVVIGVLSLSYTALGGLVVSIITDQVQGIASLLLMAIALVYLAATFREPLPTPPPCDADDPNGYCISGANEAGLGSLWSMPISLVCGVVFSEAPFQRVWASNTPRTVWRAALLASLAITAVVAFAGLCGLLAAWANLIPPGANPNLFMFYALEGSINASGQVANWVGVLMIVLMVTMSESAVDSLQNGIGAALSSNFLKGRPLIWTQVAVVAINIPLIVLGTRGFSVLQLFLVGNMASSTTLLPLLAGLPVRLYPYLGGGAVLVSAFSSFAATSIWGTWFYCNRIEATGACSIQAGMQYTWYSQEYDWRYFMSTILSSAAALVLVGTANWALARRGIKPALPGFTAPATHPELWAASAAGAGYKASMATAGSGKGGGSGSEQRSPARQQVALQLVDASAGSGDAAAGDINIGGKPESQLQAYLI